MPEDEEINMEKSTEDFINTSPLAKRVKLKGRVILERMMMSPADIAEIRAQKRYVIPKKKAVCELEVGGQVIATGKIVKKHGEYYFKVK